MSSENQKAKFENDAVELAVIAQGLAKAAELLAGQFTFVITNVPYLGRGKQDDVLKDYCGRIHPEAKADLATCFVDRCIAFCALGSSTALVAPQNWLFLTSYADFRQGLLQSAEWNVIVRLGANGFQTPMWDFNVMLLILSQRQPTQPHHYAGLSVEDLPDALQKPHGLRDRELSQTEQSDQLNNPHYTVTFEAAHKGARFSDYVTTAKGICTGDRSRFVVSFWEIPRFDRKWRPFRTSVTGKVDFSGCEDALFWEEGKGAFIEFVKERLDGNTGAWVRGDDAWGKLGVAVSRMAGLPSALYLGELFDDNSAVIVPRDKKHLLAIRAFCADASFFEQVRTLNQKLSVDNTYLAQVPCDIAYWQKVAAEKYPHGFPKPFSINPTQWLFNGHPNGVDQPLHVAAARLLSYRWPRQTGSSFPDCPALGLDGLESFADEDGIVCLPPLNHEQPAAGRLRQLLTAALGSFDERALIAVAGLKGSKSKTLEDWLRDEFFEQHAKLFHDRPFVWHLWDGRPDGFHALVNYHLLDHATLQKLTYSYLGNWIQQQSDDAKADKPGAAERLGAARALQTKLAAILEGEAPLDIFVRWKPLKEQAQGWHPDLNDGIHQNIRPFLLAGDVGKKGAGLFRTVPLALKDKDRGTEPQRLKADYPWFWCAKEPGTDPTGGKDFVGNRWNDVHLTLARKKEASS